VHFLLFVSNISCVPGDFKNVDCSALVRIKWNSSYYQSLNFTVLLWSSLYNTSRVLKVVHEKTVLPPKLHCYPTFFLSPCEGLATAYGH